MSRLPRTVWALGVVSLCMDLSSEMVHGLLPVFIVSILGARTTWLGVLEGVAQAIAMAMRVLSGAASDAMARRKPLVVLGYGLSAGTKPLFALAQGLGLVFLARFLDRAGKGLRVAPRNALLADVTPAEAYGAAYGLRQSLDSLGAALGPLAALGLMAATRNDVRAVFWWAALPAVVALVVLIAFVHEPPRAGRRPSERRAFLRRAELRSLGPSFWSAMALVAMLMLARFSEAFVILRGHDTGLALGAVPLALLALSLADSLAAYPAGRLSDRLGRRRLLALGLGVLVLADLVLAVASTPATALLGAALFGLHLGMSESLIFALAADAAPRHARGTAFGVLGLTQGLSLLLASLAAGLLWDRLGPPATFLAGGALALAALAVLMGRTPPPIA